MVGAEATDSANDIDPRSMERYRGGDSPANERAQFWVSVGMMGMGDDREAPSASAFPCNMQAAAHAMLTGTSAGRQARWGLLLVMENSGSSFAFPASPCIEW